MLALADLVLGLTSLAIVQPNTSVTADTDQRGTIRAESSAIDKLVVLSAKTSIELEGSTVVEDQAGIVRASGSAQRTLLADRYRVDLRAVS